MMKTLLILSLCLACALACNDLQKLKVKAQWAAVYGGTAKTREFFGREVWDFVFDHEPKAMELFTRVRGDNIHSPDFSAHMVRVFGGLDTLISLLHDGDTFNAQLAHLKAQHKPRNIPKEYYALLERALIHAIPLHTDHFDQDAWDSCYDVIIAGIETS